jgi:hypothetical protein
VRTAACLLLGLACLLPGQEKLQEHYPSGKLKAEYGVDAQGRRHGEYVGYYESGAARLKKSYRKGKLHGDIHRYDEKGAVVHRVRVRGAKVELFPDPKLSRGVAAFPRSVDEIRKTIASLDPPKKRFKGEKYDKPCSIKQPFEAGRLKADYLADALRHFQVHRYLAGAPHKIALSDTFTEDCQHAAVVCAALDQLSHQPKKPPGMKSAFFEKGKRGAASSNLVVTEELRNSVDMYMHDSDAGNIDVLGHRGWLLNPRMKKTGFGEAEGFCALWALDVSGKDGEGPDLIFHPARGHHPAEYFHPDRAWSIDFSAAKYRVPGKGSWKARMWLLDDEYDLEEELKLNHTSVRGSRKAGRPALIFRPALPKKFPLAGRTFLVRVEGLRPAKGGNAPLVYLVRFFSKS